MSLGFHPVRACECGGVFAISPRMNPPALPTPENTKFTWYQYAWIGWPIALVAVGGALGGACGAAAWAINRKVFLTTANPVLRYLWTGLISVASIVTYFVLAVFFLALIKKA